MSQEKPMDIAKLRASGISEESIRKLIKLKSDTDHNEFSEFLSSEEINRLRFHAFLHNKPTAIPVFSERTEPVSRTPDSVHSLFQVLAFAKGNIEDYLHREEDTDVKDIPSSDDEIDKVTVFTRTFVGFHGGTSTIKRYLGGSADGVIHVTHENPEGEIEKIKITSSTSLTYTPPVSLNEGRPVTIDETTIAQVPLHFIKRPLSILIPYIDEVGQSAKSNKLR